MLTKLKPAVKLRTLLWSLLFLIVLFLLYKAVVPFGKITYHVTPCDKSFFISELKPKDRMAEVDKKNCTQKILGEPAYFNVQTPRTFNEADVTITYRRGSGASDTPIIEMGVLADERQNYRLQPLDNSLLDSLQDWHQLIEGNTVLLWRKNFITTPSPSSLEEGGYETIPIQFSSIESFLDDLPPRNEIRTYDYNLPAQKIITNYEPLVGRQTINRELRGTYQFYTYLNNENFDFEFTFKDLNQNKDPDDIRVLVYHNDEPISEDSLVDDRGGEETRQEQELGKLILKVPDLENGFYKVSVIVNDDIVTEEISTSQKIVSFINRLWLNESLNTDLIKLYSDVDEVTASTLNPAGLQKILVNNETLDLNQTYRQFSLPTQIASSVIQFAKDDVIISGSGVFAFSPDALFNPNYKKITKATNLDASGVNYIITNYNPCLREGDNPDCRLHGEGWTTKTLHFNLKNAFRYDDAYGFIISAPGLISDDEVDDFVEMAEIEVRLKGRTLWEKLISL